MPDIEIKQPIPDGITQLYICPSCGKTVDHFFFKCERCKAKVCFNCGENIGTPDTYSHYCPECLKWLRKVVEQALKEDRR